MFGRGGIEGGGGWERPFEGRDVPRPTHIDRPQSHALELPRRPRERPKLHEHPQRSSLEASKSAGDRPEIPSARRVELTIGRPDGRGVSVRTFRLDSTERTIVIDRSRGIQIGRHNRQFNNYRYKLDRPEVSLHDMLKSHPVRQHALAKLAANPDSRAANAEFRRTLSGGSMFADRRVSFAEASGPQVGKISLRLDERGEVKIRGSGGVQAGDGGAQHNHFRYQVRRPELSLPSVLRDNPELARSLAVAVHYPGNAAAQRSFQSRLAGEYARVNGPVNNLPAELAPPAGLKVSHAAGVQLGVGNIRVDAAGLDIGKVILTGWDWSEKLDLPRPGQGIDDRVLRNEQDHDQRVGRPRISPEMAARFRRRPASAEQGFRDSASNDPSRMILPPVLDGMAAAALGDIAPGRRHLVPFVAGGISKALDSVDTVRPKVDLAIKARAPVRRGMFALDTGPIQPRETSGLEFSVSYRVSPILDGTIGVHHARIYLVDTTEQSPEASLLTHTQPPTAAPGQRQAQPAAGPSLAEVIGPDNGTPPQVAVIVSGSARIVAAGRRILDADTLVRFAREMLFRTVHDGSFASAELVMRICCALEIVVLLDPAINGGMWVDVDPTTGTAAATLLIDGFPGAPEGTMRFLRP